MIHDIDNYEKLRVIGPIWDSHEYDDLKMPIEKAFPEDQFDFEKMPILNIQNLTEISSETTPSIPTNLTHPFSG